LNTTQLVVLADVLCKCLLVSLPKRADQFEVVVITIPSAHCSYRQKPACVQKDSMQYYSSFSGTQGPMQQSFYNTRTPPGNHGYWDYPGITRGPRPPPYGPGPSSMPAYSGYYRGYEYSTYQAYSAYPPPEYAEYEEYPEYEDGPD